MKKTLVILMLGIFIALQCGCVNEKSYLEGDVWTLVDSISKESREAFLAGDIDKAMECYCEDVVVMSDFHITVKGKSKLKYMLKSIESTDMRFKSLESESIEVQRSGDFVYETGRFSQTEVMTDSDELLEQTGKYLTIWREGADGKLKIAVEVYSNNENPVKKGNA